MNQVYSNAYNVANFVCRSMAAGASAAGDLLSSGVRKQEDHLATARPTADLQNVRIVEARRDEVKSKHEAAVFSTQAAKFNIFCCAATIAIGMALPGTAPLYIPLAVMLMGAGLFCAASCVRAWYSCRVYEQELLKQFRAAEVAVGEAWSDYHKDVAKKSKESANGSPLPEKQVAGKHTLRPRTAAANNTGANLPPPPRDV
jgi:hypothetical protein